MVVIRKISVRGLQTGFAILFAMFAVLNARAQTSELDAAKIRADISEQIRKEAENNAAIAKAQAESANWAASTKAALDKAEADAAKAKSDFYQTAVPNPEAYKIADPKAPKLNATAARLTFANTSSLARDAADDVLKAVQKALQLGAQCEKSQATVVINDPKLRTLLALSTATRRSLVQAGAEIERRAAELEKQTKGVSEGDDRMVIMGAAGGIVAASSLAELAVSFARILKSQYAFDSIDKATAAQSAFKRAFASYMLKWAAPESPDSSNNYKAAAFSSN